MSQPVGQDAAVVVRFAAIAAMLALTGVQLLLPALPAIQAAFGLSAASLALVTSVFLAPGFFLAAPIGLIADRYGRRVVYCASMGTLGLGGLILLVWHSFEVLLVVRFFQGMAFAGILPTTITMIGDVTHGQAQIAGQGRRSLAMAVGNAGLPLLGGLLALLAWFAPFAVQLLCIPLAIAGWRLLDHDALARRPAPKVATLAVSLATSQSAVLQGLAFSRFFFKFAVLTYAPYLFASRDFGTLMISASLSLMAGAGMAAAVLTESMARRLAVWKLLALSLLGVAFSLAGIVQSHRVSVAFAFMISMGFADGVFGVLKNSLLVVAVPPDVRASFVAFTGAVANLGKFAAPTSIGLLLTFLSIEQAFLAIAVLALLLAPSARALRSTSEVPLLPEHP